MRKGIEQQGKYSHYHGLFMYNTKYMADKGFNNIQKYNIVHGLYEGLTISHIENSFGLNYIEYFKIKGSKVYEFTVIVKNKIIKKYRYSI